MAKFTGLILAVGLAVAAPATVLAAAPRECRPSDMVGVAEGMNASFQGGGYDQKDIDRAFRKLMASRKGAEGTLDGIINDSEIDYPFDSMDHYGFGLKFVVGVNGRVTCIALTPKYEDDPQPYWTPQRWEWAQYISQWRFRPYRLDGKIMPAIGVEWVDEFELPRVHVPMPAGDPKEVVIIQDMPAFGYHLELHSDGRAIYTSERDDDYLGPQAYHVDPKQVAYILEAAKEADFWSLRDVYSKNPETLGRYDSRIDITLGGKTKSLTDYNMEGTGLPRDAHFLAYGIRHEVDFPPWPGVSLAGIEQLKTRGFDFKSRNAGRFLLRIMATRSIKDEVALAVMALGAPQDAVGPPHYQGEDSVNLLEAALSAGRVQIASQLIVDGALKTNGQTDQARVDRALRAAVRSGEVSAIDLILPYHPAITYPDSEDQTVQISVLFELGNWDGFNDAPTAALQRLLDLGVDINTRDSNGETLLHWRANREDVEEGEQGIVPFLLAHGANLNALDKEGKPPLTWVLGEGMALLLLEHGSDPRIDKAGEFLREKIKHGEWPRVKVWLRAHGYADVLVAPKSKQAN